MNKTSSENLDKWGRVTDKVSSMMQCDSLHAIHTKTWKYQGKQSTESGEKKCNKLMNLKVNKHLKKCMPVASSCLTCYLTSIF